MYTLPNLEYEYDALGPYISKEIMSLHHSKHHQTYVDKLNMGLAQNSKQDSVSLEQLFTDFDDSLPKELKEVIRNHGGGHWNHSMFWKWMSPDGGGEPTGKVADIINKKYGNYQNFVDEFTTKALGVFGSGWVWLQPDAEIITTQNQDNPLMSGRDAPMLGLDVWEHAYYLDYKNKRDDYIAAWWNVVNWKFVEQLGE